MSDAPEQIQVPKIDASRHRTLAALEAGLRGLPRSSADEGRLRLIVSRRADGTRALPTHALLTPEAGVPGDAWLRRPPFDPDAQLAVMRHDVAELVANGQPLALFGDNLFVDFDLSDANLPVGSRLHVGGALLEVTPKPHNGCTKFRARFGQDALVFVSAKPTRSLNLRGVYWRVIAAGEVRVGDAVVPMRKPRHG